MNDSRSIPNRFLLFSRIVCLGIFVLAGVWCASAQPSLLNVSPANNTTDVPVTQSVVFTFDVPMEPSLLFMGNVGSSVSSIVWSANVNPALFVTQWSNDDMVLTCTYTGGLPGTSLISWTINPPGGFVQLGEAEDFLPLPTTSGSFTTAASCDPDGIPDSYGSISLFKSVTYLQSGTATPTLKNDEPPTFYAGVRSPQANGVTSATLTAPGNTDIPLTSFSGTFFASEQAASQTELDTSYPAGTYTFSLNRNTGGPTQVPMQMPAPSSYPNIPQVNNYQQTQTIDPTQDFTLLFDGLQNPTASDVIMINIEDSQGTTILSAPDLCLPLPLANTANTFVIPANTLSAGNSYTLRLSFGRTFYASTSNPAEFASFGALQRQTVLTIVTTGGANVPQISNSMFQNGFFSLTVGDLTPGTDYRLQYSTTLEPNSWTDLQTINSTTAMPYTDITSSQTTGQRFYRVITP